jgi:hypothetical protein
MSCFPSFFLYLGLTFFFVGLFASISAPCSDQLTMQSSQCKSSPAKRTIANNYLLSVVTIAISDRAQCANFESSSAAAWTAQEYSLRIFRFVSSCKPIEWSIHYRPLSLCLCIGTCAVASPLTLTFAMSTPFLS